MTKITKNIVFLILAGGAGKRFSPITVNKTLLPFFGKPVIQHTIEQIEKIGGKRIVVVTNKENQLWLDSFRKNFQKIEIKSVLQDVAEGMGEAVLLASPHISNQPTIILNASDFVSDSIFNHLINQAPDISAAIVGFRRDEYFNGGYLQIENNLVKSIIEKPGVGYQPSNYINLVFHFFKNPNRFVELLKTSSNNNDDHYEKALDTLLKELDVAFIPYSEYWQPLKQPHMILDLVELMLQHRLESISPKIATKKLGVQISNQAVVDGPIQFGTNVRIEAGAVIKGPTYLGDNVIIGNHTLIRNSIIESNSTIGFGSEVARSYIGPNCALHHNFVGDSILESNINPSWGTAFTNLRLDNQEVKIAYHSQQTSISRTKFGSIVGSRVFFGSNCTIMPGTIINADSKIYPNLCIKSNLSGIIKTSNIIK